MTRLHRLVRAVAVAVPVQHAHAFLSAEEAATGGKSAPVKTDDPVPGSSDGNDKMSAADDGRQGGADIDSDDVTPDPTSKESESEEQDSDHQTGRDGRRNGKPERTAIWKPKAARPEDRPREVHNPLLKSDFGRSPEAFKNWEVNKETGQAEKVTYKDQLARRKEQEAAEKDATVNAQMEQERKELAAEQSRDQVRRAMKSVELDPTKRALWSDAPLDNLDCRVKGYSSMATAEQTAAAQTVKDQDCRRAKTPDECDKNLTCESAAVQIWEKDEKPGGLRLQKPDNSYLRTSTPAPEKQKEIKFSNDLGAWNPETRQWKVNVGTPPYKQLQRLLSSMDEKADECRGVSTAGDASCKQMRLEQCKDAPGECEVKTNEEKKLFLSVEGGKEALHMWRVDTWNKAHNKWKKFLLIKNLYAGVSSGGEGGIPWGEVPRSDEQATDYKNVILEADGEFAFPKDSAAFEKLREQTRAGATPGITGASTKQQPQPEEKPESTESLSAEKKLEDAHARNRRAVATRWAEKVLKHPSMFADAEPEDAKKKKLIVQLVLKSCHFRAEETEVLKAVVLKIAERLTEKINDGSGTQNLLDEFKTEYSPGGEADKACDRKRRAKANDTRE